MTNPNVPNPHGPNPNYTPNFDPNQYPEAAAAEYMLPTDPAEFDQQRELLRRQLGTRVKKLEDVADKPANQRTDVEEMQLMWAAANMEPVQGKDGKNYFANIPYNEHPLSKGEPHGIQDNERTRKVFEVGRHLLNQAELRAQYEELQAALEEEAEQQRRAAQARQDIEDAANKANAEAERIKKRQPHEVEADSRASYGNLLAWATDPSAPEMTKEEFKAAEQDAKNLRPEERYRLQLELEDWLKNNENTSGRANNLKINVEQGLAKDMDTHRVFTDEKNARNVAIVAKEVEPGDHTPLGRFEQVKAEFIRDKIKAVEKTDAAKAWDEAHPTTETDAMIGLHKYMHQYARLEQFGAQRSKRKEGKIQSELIELMAKDARALEAFKKSGLAANKKIREGVDEMLDGINRRVNTYNRRVTALDENDPRNLDEDGLNRPAKRLRAHIRENGGLGTYQEMAFYAHKTDEDKKGKRNQALYNEYQANRMPRQIAMMDAGEEKPYDTSEAEALAGDRPDSRRYYLDRELASPKAREAYDKDMAEWQNKVDALALPEFGPKADPAIRMTEARRKVIDRMEGEEPWGDTLSDGKLSNWLVRKAQQGELARAAKGDPAAEAELRRRGIRVPRLATNRQKNDARVDKINNAYDKLTGGVRKVASKVRRPRRPRS